MSKNSLNCFTVCCKWIWYLSISYHLICYLIQSHYLSFTSGLFNHILKLIHYLITGILMLHSFHKHHNVISLLLICVYLHRFLPQSVSQHYSQWRFIFFLLFAGFGYSVHISQCLSCLSGPRHLSGWSYSVYCIANRTWVWLKCILSEVLLIDSQSVLVR